MSEPILRAKCPDGEVYDDPSEDALYMFMEDLEASGSPLLIDRLEEGREDEWALVRLMESGLYEFESDRHVHYVSGFASVHEFLTRWAFDLQ
jgi:hypothetical protein